MSLRRIGAGKRWSDIIVHGDRMFVVEVPERLDEDITGQTRQVLASLEDSLRQGGSRKDLLLTVTIYLADVGDLDAFNAVWDTWVLPGAAPVRACVGVRLAKPEMRVELQVTAAVA